MLEQEEGRRATQTKSADVVTEETSRRKTPTPKKDVGSSAGVRKRGRPKKSLAQDDEVTSLKQPRAKKSTSASDQEPLL
jgi:hypothetical protein